MQGRARRAGRRRLRRDGPERRVPSRGRRQHLQHRDQVARTRAGEDALDDFARQPPPDPRARRIGEDRLPLRQERKLHARPE